MMFPYISLSEKLKHFHKVHFILRQSSSTTAAAIRNQNLSEFDQFKRSLCEHRKNQLGFDQIRKIHQHDLLTSF